jgi:hypothetical protein
MTRKQKVIGEASKRLLLTDLTCWNVVEEILNDVYKEGIKTGSSERNKKYKKPIDQYSGNNLFIESFESIADTVALLKIPRHSLERNLRGGSKRCHGFIFKYAKK